jgi:Fic family protein
MGLIMLIIAAAIMVILIPLSIISRNKSADKESQTTPLEQANAVKQQIADSNSEKVLLLFNGQARVTNSDVQSALGVSDATATRYLQTLEDQGQIVQRQDTGRGVYYEKVNK